MNTKVQSNIGLGQAIAYFTSLGYSVSIPLTESQRYDIVVDDGEKLSRVEVKTTGMISKYGTYYASISTSGGNQSWSGEIKYISSKECDFVFIYTMGGDMYLFPSTFCENKRKIALSKDKSEYKIN